MDDHAMMTDTALVYACARAPMEGLGWSEGPGESNMMRRGDGS